MRDKKLFFNILRNLSQEIIAKNYVSVCKININFFFIIENIGILREF